MAIELLKATIGIAIVFGVWLLVQRLWLAQDRGRATDEDALAGRTSCHDCTCTGDIPCENKPSARSAAPPPN